MKFEKLERPQIAYAVRHTDCIITIQVVQRFTEHTYHSFLVGKAVWVDENDYQYPREGEWLPLTVDPSARGNPFEHPIVGWTLEEAADILREKCLKEAQYNRERAERFLEEARAIETRDYRKLICGESSEDYVSPFTGEKR